MPRRNWSLSSSLALGIALGTIFALTGLAGTIYPFQHWTCQKTRVANELHWMPEALVNAPYAGIGGVNSSWVNSAALYTNAGGFPGTYAVNGSVSGAFIQVSLAVDSLSNVTTPGLGSDSRCGASFAVELPMNTTKNGSYAGGNFDYSWQPLFGPGALSDKLEPRMVNLTPYPGDATPFFSNGYFVANTQNVSTCGLPIQSLHVESSYLTVWIHFTITDVSHLEPLVLPYDQSFNYHFPANFGTWAIDNLSVPGGPGGGWAFDFLGPCT